MYEKQYAYVADKPHKAITIRSKSFFIVAFGGSDKQKDIVSDVGDKTGGCCMNAKGIIKQVDE